MIKVLKHSLFALLFWQSVPLWAVNLKMKTSLFEIQIDSVSGSLQSIVNQRDKYQMNWIMTSDGAQYPWQTSQYGWGMGFCRLNGDSVRWSQPKGFVSQKDQLTFTYQIKDVQLTIVRKLNKDGSLTESFRFVNKAEKPVLLTDIGICTPFNDNYPDSKTCVVSRCNAHIWAGGNDSYVFAERMGGEAPHLGLVLTQGTLKSYEIQNRNLKPNGSNARGTVILNPSDIRLESKGSYTLQWNVFATTDWNDFYRQALGAGFVKATAKQLVVEREQHLDVCFESAQKLRNVQCFLNDDKVPFLQNGNLVTVNVLPKTIGEQVVKISYNDRRTTFVRAYRIENIDSLLRKRANFIVSKQQMNDPNDVRNGAYMVYDTELKKIYLNGDKRRASDVNEGRERVGMGVFLAMYLQQHPDADIEKSLKRYCEFVHTKLQRPDYSVASNVEGTGHQRVYNYPWVGQLYLEMYQLTGDAHYLRDSYKTLRKYFVDSKCSYYGIGVPAQKILSELGKAGLTAERDTLLRDCRTTADKFLQTSLYFPKHEVNYEQSIVSPSVVFLLEMYQITHEPAYLKEGEKQLEALEAFAGLQPDYHLNEIGIRHWDGYWFGKRKFWGDIMPHYWSTITSEAYVRYAQITGKQVYYERAETILRNNLCLFFTDGTASCAYVYPSKVNGAKAAFFDPFVNDQDWALVYYLKAKNLKANK